MGPIAIVVGRLIIHAMSAWFVDPRVVGRRAVIASRDKSVFPPPIVVWAIIMPTTTVVSAARFLYLALG
jgi:hypothetical protein